jgi:transcriptional regulator with XRE-family HTH domain
MTAADDIREFLTTRRARLTPQQAGLPDFGGRRRVPGLRREEVALLAGMSTEYYVRLERGHATGFSEAVLDGVARALQLDDVEQAHLNALVRSASEGSRPARTRSAPTHGQVRANVQQTIDAMSTVPVYVQNGRLDSVATNQLGRVLFSEMFLEDRIPVNAARFGFLDPRAQTFYRDWESAVTQMVPVLRREAGLNPPAHRSGWRALHAQRALSEAVVVARRARAPHRGEEHPSSARRRSGPDFRDAGYHLGARSPDADLLGGGRLAVARALAAVGEPGRDGCEAARGVAGSQSPTY